MNPTPQPPSDNTLIQKLEGYASLTNRNILSEDEVLRGRILLSMAKSTFLELDPLSSIERRTLTEHISKLCVALAPHKRLPLELLEHIFCFLGCTATIPPVMSRPPWSLGQVCSTWRQLSRSLPQLWGTINFYFEDSNYSYTSLPFDLEKSMKELECASELVPEVARLRLTADDTIDVPTRRLIPYLKFITDLYWCTPEQEGMEVFPPGSLSRLVTLEIYLDQDVEVKSGTEGDITQYPHLFEPSQLRTLRLCSDSPRFLLTSDIPWQKLRLLSLNIVNMFMNTFTRSAWLHLSQSFHRMESIQELTLDTSDNQLISIVLSSDLRWHQLTYLRVLWRNNKQPSDVGEVMVTLHKCTAVVKIELATHADMVFESARPLTFTPIHLSDLRTLELSGPFTSSTALALAGQGMLRSFKAYRGVSLTLSQLYTIVQQCPNLNILYLTISPGGQTIPRPNTILLPYLTRLTLNVDDGQFLPMGLMLPSLAELTFQAHHGFGLLEPIADFIIHSNSRLRRFTCDEAYDHVFPSTTTRLTDLLSSLKYCTSLKIDGVVLTEDVFEEIASASLLPCLEELETTTSEGEAFLSAVMRRLQRDSMEGKVNLKWIRMRCMGGTSQEYTRFKDQIAEIRNLYGLSNYRFQIT
ncbi:hypothetical protein H0H92_005248 [Tricholoma furcatifolium]|nr:hypothetical protein H0H92_005248 [Tricholoma furcatifolium]